MDKRSRIWIIVLALLLAAALALCVVFKLRLDDISGKYDASDTLRIAAEEKLAETAEPTDESANEPTDEPAATDDSRDGEIETLTAELEAAKTRESELQAENESLKAELAAYSEATAEPESTVDVETLQSELAAARADAETLAERAESAEAELAAMTAGAETVAAETERAEAAEAELAAMTKRAENAEEELAAQTERAETAEAELAKVRAELAAYRANADVADGEKHLSAAAGDVVYVSADGVNAEYVVANNTASGNSIVFELSLDGEAIYNSEKLAPGERIDGFTLANVLNPGSYEASISIKTLNSKGDVISVTVTTVTIEVAR